MKKLVIIICVAALGAFFGWYDFSRHDNGAYTVACFALAIVIIALTKKKTR